MVRSDFTKSLELVAPVQPIQFSSFQKRKQRDATRNTSWKEEQKSRGPVENTEVGTSVRIRSSRPELFGCDKKKQEVA